MGDGRRDAIATMVVMVVVPGMIMSMIMSVTMAPTVIVTMLVLARYAGALTIALLPIRAGHDADPYAHPRPHSWRTGPTPPPRHWPRLW